MFRVYVLNSSSQCVSTTTVGRALHLVSEGHAEVVKWSDKVFHSAKQMLRIPLIIRIYRYVKAYGRSLKYSNRFVWERDGYICQYCEVKITTKAELSTDHVHPESKGGKTSYDNMVTCCRTCNAKKDNKSCEEAKMWPIRTPFRPQMSKNMSLVVDEANRLLALMYKDT